MTIGIIIDLLTLTKELCAIHSVTGAGGDRQIAAALQARVPEAELSWQASASPGAGDDLLLTRRGSGSKDILLLGHYDTVPGEQVAEQHGQRFRALGAYDMKGGIAIATDLLSQLPAERFATLQLALLGDEEWRQQPPRLTGHWDLLLAFEGQPAGGQVLTSRFAAAAVQITLSAPSQQRATRPLAGPSPLLQLSAVLALIETSNNQHCQLTISAIHSQEQALNVIPENVHLAGVLRYRSEADLQHFLQRWPANIAGLALDINIQQLLPPWPGEEPGQKLLQGLGIVGCQGLGSSDICHFANQADYAFDGLGPAGGADHSPEEYIEIDSLSEQQRRAEQIIAAVIA